MWLIRWTKIAKQILVKLITTKCLIEKNSEHEFNSKLNLITLTLHRVFSPLNIAFINIFFVQLNTKIFVDKFIWSSSCLYVGEFLEPLCMLVMPPLKKMFKVTKWDKENPGHLWTRSRDPNKRKPSGESMFEVRWVKSVWSFPTHSTDEYKTEGYILPFCCRKSVKYGIPLFWGTSMDGNV